MRPLCTVPSYSCSISPAPHRRRRVADGGASLSEPISVCRKSHATSREEACRAASADAVSARPSRSACSVHLPTSPAGSASSSGPRVRSAARNGLLKAPDQAAGQLRADGPLAEPDPEVDLLRPEVLRPHVLVDLVQVLPPARAAVGRRVQAGRPLHHRVRPVRDPQVHLGVLHPDRGQRHGDVGRQRLALVRGGELVRDRRHPVVRPGVRVGQQHPVVEVSDRQAAAPLRLPAHHVPRVVAPAE